MATRRPPFFVRGVALLALVGGLASPRRVAADDPNPSAPPPAPVPAPDPDDDGGVPESLDARIKKAVERGVRWLRSKARPDGSFGPLAKGDETTYNGTTDAYTSPFGATSLVAYTLMKCGVPASDPQLKKCLAWLKKSKDDGDAYETAMELLAVTATADPFKKTKDTIAAGEKVRLSGENRAWAETLLANLVKLRGATGWRYWGKDDPTKGGNQDLSSTQLAVLAMFAAERCGLKIDPSVWSDVIRFALEQQEEDGPEHPRAVHPKPPKAAPTPAAPEGTTAAPPASERPVVDRARGFAYQRAAGPDASDRAPRGSMTACGLGILSMARFALMTRFPKAWAKVDAARVQAGVYDGLAWLDRNWSPWENAAASDEGWHLYYLYCVERAMDLVGSQRLGQRLWYVEMAEQVVARQHDDGSWEGAASSTYNAVTLDTCFALLFLQRATKGGIPYPSVTGGSDLPSVDNR